MLVQSTHTRLLTKGFSSNESDAPLTSVAHMHAQTCTHTHTRMYTCTHRETKREGEWEGKLKIKYFYKNEFFETTIKYQFYIYLNNNNM